MEASLYLRPTCQALIQRATQFEGMAEAPEV
jgi:hypothetical protein